MAQLWGGRFTKETDQRVKDFNDSLRFELGEDAKVIDNVGYEDTRKLLVLLKW